MLVSVFTDASWCPHKKVGGWGAWVKSGRGQFQKGGPFKTSVVSSQVAEMYAVLNGITVAMKTGLALPGDTLLVQTDCQSAIYAFGRESKARCSEAQQACIMFKQAKAKHGVIVELRYVPAHTKGDKPRLWVNNLCDSLAREGMLKAREWA